MVVENDLGLLLVCGILYLTYTLHLVVSFFFPFELDL
jgi:hypothetical protein